eukprot:TRINITY_DN14277_c0_g1_i4.p1 TRINITY_DN14277_c0_g1~~TRINITY_DN14277_c0_g1_i4.p1  ORF type:complete len:198 (-),score=50.01 TRINITY_DN14277_c0_g1_i4:316-909(-)
MVIDSACDPCVFILCYLICFFFFLMIRRPPRSTHCISSAASDVYKRQSQLISKEEQKILAENFKKIDINNDGAIAKKEIEDYLKSYMTQEEAQQAIDTILSKIDVNQNGKISYTEFLSHQMNFQNMQNEKNLLQAFQFFDQDNNKFITQEDINKISNFSPCGLDWNQVLQQYDKNLDKKIDFNEFKLIAEQIYKKNQ